MTEKVKNSFWKNGEHWVWFNAGAVAISLVMVIGLILLITVKGLSHFWPSDLTTYQISTPAGEELVLGEIYDKGEKDIGNDEVESQLLLKVGNRDIYGLDFRWIDVSSIQSKDVAPEIYVFERREWGAFYGTLHAVKEGDVLLKQNLDEKLDELLDRATDLHEQIRDIEKDKIGSINYDIEQLRLERRKLEIDGENTPEILAQIEAEEKKLNDEFAVLQNELGELYTQFNRDSIIVKSIEGREVTIKLSHVVRAFQPNSLSLFGKVGHYFDKIGEFIFDEPREANTEGGVFPAIFGTVLMVMLMSVLVTPFGVIAAIYLREYAKQGFLTRLIRIAVNNLAGVPSIVYGVFGLGFFVYFLGGSIDELFYAEAKPAPTFGTPGLMWASVTLALLTLPVVIVSTEEGLARIPKAIREGSLALGATKVETLWRTVLPMASPAMMTGLILAIARAAGEVAPLMLVGVVKLAPTLPLDGNAPFLHLERKFMHLGFHIYDVGFQSPNVEAARPLVFATALLLVLVIILLNIAAIKIRNNLREKYKSLEH